MKVEIFYDKCTKVKLLETIKFKLKNKEYEVPIGFVSDGGTIPRIV